MYNILLGLAQMQVVNESGQPEPLISVKKLRSIMEEILGFKLKTKAEERVEQQSTIEQMFQGTLSQLNPISNEQSVQTPNTTPGNLQQTVPQMPNGDPRSVNI
jgi:hypothetical protein